MASETVTEYETVERERERTLCDLCGQADDELEEFGEFQTLALSTDSEDLELETYPSDGDLDLGRKRIRSPADPRATMSIRVVYTGPTVDLCPICFNTLFGDDATDP